jgi:hypothetical protein
MLLCTYYYIHASSYYYIYVELSCFLMLLCTYYYILASSYYYMDLIHLQSTLPRICLAMLTYADVC